MDEFPHVSVEHEVLKRHIRYSFNPRKCQAAGLDHVPNAEEYELLKLRRVFHFNRNTPDHVVLTVPRPVFLLIDRETSELLQNDLNYKEMIEVEKSKRRKNQEVFVNIDNEGGSNQKRMKDRNDSGRKALSNLSVSVSNSNDFDFSMLNDDYLRFTKDSEQNTVMQCVNTCIRPSNEEYNTNLNNFGSSDLEVVKSQFNMSLGSFGNIIKQMMQNTHEASKMTIQLHKETRRSLLKFSLHFAKNLTSDFFKARQFIKLCFLSNAADGVWRSIINHTQMDHSVRINCTKGILGATITFSLATKDFNGVKFMLDKPNFKNCNEKAVIGGKNLVISLTTLFVKLSQKLALCRKRDLARCLLEKTRKIKGQTIKVVPEHCLNFAKSNYLQVDSIETANKSITREVPAKLDFCGFSTAEQTVHGEVDKMRFFMDILSKGLFKPSEASSGHKKLKSRQDLHQKLFVKSTQFACTKCCKHFPSIKLLKHHLKIHHSARNNIGEKPYNTASSKLRTHSKVDYFARAITEKTDELLECDQCGYITMYRNKLDAHMEIHDTKQIYHCDICSFSTAQLSYFETHRLFHQVEVKKPAASARCEEKYRCEECGFSTKLRYAMVHHGKQQHSAEAFINVAMAGCRKKKRMCTRCAYSGLKKVRSKHRGACKKYKCDFCGFAIYCNHKFRMLGALCARRA